jgi:predicted nucleic acid-binding protein
VRVPKIYLETTVFNYYFDTARDAHADTVRLFNEMAEGKFEPFTSDYAVRELMNAPQEKRDKMIGLITRFDIKVLEESEAAKALADHYMENKLFPLKYMADALHVSCASVAGMDIIISLNFKHIMKARTVQGASAVNALNGYSNIQIWSPMEVVGNDDDEE